MAGPATIREPIVRATATPCFLGRESELARLGQAIRKRESLLIWGAANAGKSTLVSQAISRLPERERKWCVVALGNGTPQDVLRSIALGFAEDPLFKAKFRADTGFGASFAHWVKAQTSLRLRGLLYRASKEGQYRIFLEDLAPMTHMLARIAKQLIWNQSTPVYAIARGWTYVELGHAAQLYWNDKLRLHVGALSSAAARELLEISIRKHGLLGFDLSGFREDILDFSAMLPGAIVRMCEAAGDSHYHFEGRIKTKLLHVDYLLNHCQGPLGAAAPQIAERRKDTWHA